MAYDPKKWSLTTPITPEALNHMEEGISNSVDLNSNQTIDGIKTFSQLPLSSEVPTQDNQLVNKKYVDDINEDSGRIPLSIASGFTYYNSQDECWYRKVGKMVEVNAVLKPTNDITSGGNDSTIFNLPEGYRPASNIRTVCQGSGMNRWLLQVNINGTATISRYGINDAITLSSSAWLPLRIVFFAR